MSDPTQNLIQAVDRADSPESLVAAVRSLAAAKDEAGIGTLIAVLGYNNPVAAVAAVEGLTQLGAKAVQPLIEKLDGYNYGARAYSIRAIAAIADPLALEVLTTAAATDFAPSVRRAAAKGLGQMRWQNIATPAERAAGQQQALETLLSVSQDSDWSIRYAAVVGLQGLLQVSDLQAKIQPHLIQMIESDSDPAVRARAQLAINEVVSRKS
ncbi:MAG: Phycocyanobilin lyase subunit beta [Chroococcidiopsis sp. SAG 2025]|uniref:HEAT repeat domain-containing protein n=1 Tax=Chroococcidiopsis sp. SAG 2025 TaxID=171389 RepID=UPI00293739D0|nr:HEAT repeat domain-containing protein [Chroococcidiopsis sp. SAG 2025]MDV2993916.1 Phycocyanobilin lyase subunit beta [Chroococcidiopsis sp. SAG 2025]